MVTAAAALASPCSCRSSADAGIGKSLAPARAWQNPGRRPWHEDKGAHGMLSARASEGRPRGLVVRAALADAPSAPSASSTVAQGYAANGAAVEGRGFTGTETVSSVMTSMVIVATPDTLLGDILEHFAFYTGLPVVQDRTMHLLGMITNIDMYKKQRGKAANVANTYVREVMTSPVVAVFPDTLVSYAAGLMLKYRVHRLPVIDRESRVVGIVTNEDLYQTLTASTRPASESVRMVP